MTRGGFYSVDSLSGVHALVVDVEPSCRELLVAILTYCGAFVTAVATSEHALRVMRVTRPDVLVVDADLPEIDAYGLMRRVRALEPEAGGIVPAVALRTSPAPEDHARARAAGFAASLAKPLDPWELCRLISNLTFAS